MTQDAINTYCGTVAIVGLPNAGKSSLLNTLVDFKIAPVHPKPQMTRQNILGIITENNHQLIFIDTPGYNNREELLTKRMLQDIRKALDEADVVLFLWGKDQKDFAIFSEWVTKLATAKPSYLVLNKKDLYGYSFEEAHALATQLNLQTFEVSAKTKEGLPELLASLTKHCYLHPYFYPEDDVSTASHREITKGFLQESLMEVLGDELPYQTAVVIEAYQEQAQLHSIRAVIVVNRDSQKGMVIGKKGSTLGRIGQRTRLALEKNFGVKVYLELFVKVEANWIKNQQRVDEYNE